MDCEENPTDINSLLNSFSSLQTTDHDDLVIAFQNIANELSYTTARFFLEMNNWNLQAAVCCYFDFVASSNQNGLGVSAMPSMCIVKEMTIGLGESVTPNTPFTQSWMLENNGIVAWPQGCYLKLVSEINNDGKMFVPSIAPNDTHILTINLVSPSEFGQFRSQFCLCTPAGVTFGPIIWSVVDVSVAGTLALTQQLTQLHTSEQTQQAQQNVAGNWDEDGMQGTEVTGVTLPQSSNSGGSGQLQHLLPAPQNSPNTTHDEEMMEKINL